MSTEINVSDANLRVTFFDEGNPMSLINRVWPELVDPLIQVGHIFPNELFFYESQIRAFCRPEERDHRARLSFWDEYALACAKDRRMSKECVLGDITPEIWRKVYLSNYRKLLFILHQPSNYASSMRHLLDIGIDRLKEIMEMPILRNGLPDHKAVANILKAFQLVDLRVKGAVVQRLQIDQRSLNVNQNFDVKGTERELSFMGMDQLESMKRELEAIEARRATIVSSLPPSVALQNPLDAITNNERELYQQEVEYHVEETATGGQPTYEDGPRVHEEDAVFTAPDSDESGKE